MKQFPAPRHQVRAFDLGILALAFCLCPCFLAAQSSNGVLSGKVTGRADGHPLRALMTYRNVNNGATSYALSNALGLYSFPALQPGIYTVRADTPTQPFVSQEQTGIEITVGGQIEVNFVLEAKGGATTPTGPTPGAGATAAPAPPSSASGTAALKGFISSTYGQDAEVPSAVLIALPVALAEALVGSLSTVIDERKITELPYSGRDVYTLLVMQPGVTSDSATGHGLGLAVDGQRVAGTNFLLDGVDNNDALLTGPSTSVSADAVEEYRMTTNNFSAEFGRATAFIANVITRTGSNAWHGSAYEFFNHDRLNANSFSDNFYGEPRTPFRFNQFGGTAGGPIHRDRLFFFASFERTYSSSQSFDQPSNVPGFQSPLYVPSAAFVASLPPNSLARQVLGIYPPPLGQPVPGKPYVQLTIHYPLLQHNTLFSGRADYGAPGGKNRFTVRYAFSQNTAPDFVDSVYPNSNATLVVRAQNAAFNYTRQLLGGVNELKLGWNRSRVSFDRPDPQTPTLISLDDVSLPGSAAAYGYDNQDGTGHVVDNFSLLRGKHSLVFGFDGRWDNDNMLISTGAAGQFVFNSLQDFGANNPSQLHITVDRVTGHPLPSSGYARSYRQLEWAGFVQDNWKITRRFTLNLGLRYEYFGVPQRTDGPADYNLFYGPGSNLQGRLATATLQSRAAYAPDHKNFAPRLGVAWDATGRGKTVLRGGYGIAYDRIFNEIWEDLRNNSLAYIDLTCPVTCPVPYQFPASSAVPANVALRSPTIGLPQAVGSYITTQVDPNLRTPYAQSWFAGIQHQATRDLLLELDYAGSRGRKLLALDDINRKCEIVGSDGVLTICPSGMQINPNFHDISYRGNQGKSDYESLQASARQRFSHGVEFQVSYTFSRTLDTQSDPFRNPASVNANVPAFMRLGDPGLLSINTETFAQQFNSNADWGPSDFDQRQNLVFSVIAVSPAKGPLKALTRDWQLSAFSGFRSGFPFSVLSSGNAIFSPSGLLRYNRADFSSQGNVNTAFLSSPRAGADGEYLLNANAFQDPAFNQLGASGRNAFHGPGFWNADFGVSRSVRWKRLGEEGHVQFRAEFYNIFNHTNLGNPDNATSSPTFGLATYGRQGFSGSLPIVSPIAEQPRRIQLAVKFIW